MRSFLLSVLIGSVLLLIQCAKPELVSNERSIPKVEISEAKKFVLGRWKSVDEGSNGYFLIFRDDNIVIQELYKKDYNGEINRYEYRLNEDNEIEIEQNYQTNLIIIKVDEDEFRLKPKIEGGFVSPPILFFFHKFRRVLE